MQDLAISLISFYLRLEFNREEGVDIYICIQTGKLTEMRICIEGGMNFYDRIDHIRSYRMDLAFEYKFSAQGTRSFLCISFI